MGVEVRNSAGSLVGSLSGITDAAGLFTSNYLTDLPDDTYTAEVVALSHATYVWNGDLNPTANDGDADGLPDQIHAIPHGSAAAASSTASTAETTSATAFPTFNSFSTNDAGASTSDTNTDVPLASTDADQQPATYGSRSCFSSRFRRRSHA